MRLYEEYEDYEMTDDDEEAWFFITEVKYTADELDRLIGYWLQMGRRDTEDLETLEHKLDDIIDCAQKAKKFLHL